MTDTHSNPEPQHPAEGGVAPHAPLRQRAHAAHPPLWLMPMGTACLFAELVLAAMVLWKETPVFWRNEGGYPVWVRGAVLLGFYPLLLAALSGVILFTASLVRERRDSGRVAGHRLVLGGVLWLLVAAVLLVLLANNLSNLAEGRPFHWHDR